MTREVNFRGSCPFAEPHRVRPLRREPAARADTIRAVDRAGDLRALACQAGCFTRATPRASAATTTAALTAERDEREPYTLVMPPPNVTAILHVGHGLNNTVQDVLIRWARMKGDEALWVPGTDHAGIATQNVVEKQLAKEGLTRYDLGREAFVERTERVRRGDRRRRSSSSSRRSARRPTGRARRTRFSPELSRAVREAFVRLYERGLIYRGHRVIHWCPRCLTSLSDEEAEFHGDDGHAVPHRVSAAPDDPARSHHRRHDAPRDDARRRRGRRESRRRALSGAHRQARACCRSSTSTIPSSPTSTPIRRSAPAW